MTDIPVYSSKPKEPAVLRGQGFEQREGRPPQAGRPYEQRTRNPASHLTPFYHQPLGNVPGCEQPIHGYGLCTWWRTVHVVAESSRRGESRLHIAVICLLNRFSLFFRGSRTQWRSSMPLKWPWPSTTSTHTTSSIVTSSQKTFSSLTMGTSRLPTLVSRSTVRGLLGRCVAHPTIWLRRSVFASDHPTRAFVLTSNIIRSTFWPFTVHPHPHTTPLIFLRTTH